MADDGEPARIASPEATGGIGTSYEHAAVAAYLSALLTHSRAPACPGVVTSVAVQQKASGRPLDDVVIEWKDDAGRLGTLDLQLKRRLTVSTQAGKDFAGIVIAAWATMKLPDFVDGRDLAGGLFEVGSIDNFLAGQQLSDQARLEVDAEVFAKSVAGQMGAPARNLNSAVETVLVEHLGTPPTSEQLHLFWRNFVLGQLQATNDRGADRLRAIDQLQLVRPEGGANPTQVFAILEALAKQLNVRAVRVDRGQTLTLLRDRSGTVLSELPNGLDDALQNARRGAEIELKGFRDRDQAHLIDPAFVTIDGPSAKRRDRAVQLDQVEADLRSDRSLVLVGEPGAGKSNALQQISVKLLAQPALVPIVRKLPSLALRGDSIVSQLCGKGSFATFSETNFATLAQGAQIVLLLDGWNELNADQRQWAWSELDALRRDYPALFLIIATRAGTASPFSQARTLDVLPFDRARQLDAAARLLGPVGHDLVVRARAIPALRPLLRTPLFLAAVLRQGASGNLPADRETVIAGLVAEAGGAPARREQLRVALDGQHLAFLRAISDRLMNAGTTLLSEAELMPLIGEVAADLRARQLFTPSIGPQAVLDLLISHHLLVGIGAPGERTISLQHQLIQEWFASFRVADLITGQETGAINRALRALVDAPFWSVTILFAVERLGHACQAKAQLQSLILTTLGIDSFLAADMFQRARACLDQALDRDLIAFAERWMEDDPSRATRFMLATGLEQFSYALWGSLENGTDILFYFHRSGRTFPIDALRPDWDRRFPKLKDETRRVLLADLVDQGESASVEMAIGAAMHDPSEDVVSGVIDYLDFRDERAGLERLLGGVSKAMWKELARGREPNNLTDSHRARWQQLRRKRFASAEGIEWIRLALEFDCATPEAIIAATLDLKTDNHWTSHELQQTVFERFPETFQKVLVARLLDERNIPYRASQFLTDVEPAEQSALVEIATAKDRTFSRHELAAQLLGRDAIARLIDRMIGCAGDRKALRSEEMHAVRDAVRDALRKVRLDHLVPIIIAQDDVDAPQAAVHISVLADWRGHEEERTFAISAEERTMLVQRAQHWTALLFEQGEQLRRYDLAELARLIGRLASTELVPLLLTLWDRDRTQHAEERALRAINPHHPPANEAFMGYDNMYRGAAVAIGGEAVVDAISDRLGDPAQEVDSAIVLGQLLEVDPVQRGPLGPTLDDMAARRDRLLERRASPPHPVAARIIDRINNLVATGDPESIGRAFQLALPVTLMNYGDRGPDLLALIEAGRDNGLLRNFCKVFSERGEALPAYILRHGLAAGIAELAAMKWVQDNDYWRVTEWLRLIAFADDAEAALPDLADLPDGLQRSYRIRDLARALGYSVSPTAVAALVAILRQALELLSEDWPDAMARIASPEADAALLEAVAAAPDGPKGWRDTYRLRECLASALARSSDVRDRAKAMLGEIAHQGKRATIADALAQTMDEDDAIMLLGYGAEPAGTAIARILLDRLEKAAVSRLPVEGTSNAFELEGAPLPRLRRLAFQHQIDHPDERLYKACLRSIDRLRDYYGKPVNETYHPHIEADHAWPKAAEPYWSALDRAADSVR